MEALSQSISVILPVKHWRKASAMAIRSILDQTCENIELLLIGQPDCCSLASNLQASGISDKRIRVIPRSTPGIVSALNTGLQHAKGDFIARMDDDDIAYPERLQTQLRYLNEHNNTRLCAGKVRFVDSKGSLQGVGEGNQRYAAWLNELTDPGKIALACFAENPMPHPTLMAHRNVWQQLAGYREFDGPEDHDLILRAMHLNIPMGKPDSVVLDWREHDTRLTHTDSRYRREAFIKLAADTLVQNATLSDTDISLQSGVWIAGTGKHARYWHDVLAERAVSVCGFVDVARVDEKRRKRNLPVISYKQLANSRNAEFIISAVSQYGAKAAIKQFCKTQQWAEGTDFIMGC